MSMVSVFAADVQAVESDLPVTFYFREKAYTGTRTAIADTFQLQDAGILQGYDFELIARCSIFGTRPPEKNEFIEIVDTLKVGNPRIKYRIEKITPSQDGVIYTFGCVQAQ